MKRFLSFIFIVIAIAGGAIAFTVLEKGAITDNTAIAYNKQSRTSQQTIHFDLVHSITSGQETLHNIHSFQLQQASIRIFSSSHNAFRLQNIKQQAHLQFLACLTIYTRKSASSKYNGYYLYHLCKLLI